MVQEQIWNRWRRLKLYVVNSLSFTSWSLICQENLTLVKGYRFPVGLLFSTSAIRIFPTLLQGFWLADITKGMSLGLEEPYRERLGSYLGQVFLVSQGSVHYVRGW